MAKPIWGVDSAAPVDERLLNCVVSNYGKPEFWGRYIRTVPGAADGLTRREASFLRENGIKIMPIYSAFRRAVGYDQGRIAARNAHYHAKLLGIPRGVVVFANVERFFEVDDAWIRGWADVFYASEYKAGFYHDPREGGFAAAYCRAASASENVREHAILWSAEPDPGATKKAEAPAFEPATPPCRAHVWVWQYGRDADACPIDTNLASPLLVKHLWA